MTAGLEAGARVVVVGQRGLAEGDPLIVSREGRCCENGRVVYSHAERRQPASERGPTNAGNDAAPGSDGPAEGGATRSGKTAETSK